MDDNYIIEINLGNKKPSILDEIKSLERFKKPVEKKEPEPMMIISNKPKKKKDKSKKEKKPNKKSVLYGAFGSNDDDSTDNSILTDDEEEDTLLDVDKIMRELEEEEIDDSIIDSQKKNYRKLKKDNNDFKKEFAEELTLLYNLLDETSKFGKGLERDLSTLKGSKTRGLSKYTNDLTELILTSKQNKLNILKEITSVKKTIADLKMKSEAKNKSKDNGENSPEYLASAYLKNVLNHGRTDFISNITNQEIDSNNPRFSSDYYIPDDDDQYNNFMLSRLNEENPYRSDEGSKYIEYENYDVKLYVKKCIDTGEWEFIALDKNKRQIYDYPLPSKRDSGRMKFSDDGSYATDAKGRIYNVIEYFLPDDE